MMKRISNHPKRYHLRGNTPIRSKSLCPQDNQQEVVSIYKKIIISITIIFLLILISVSYVFFIRTKYTKEDTYIGHVEVLYFDNVSIPRIYEISYNENISIENINNVTFDWREPNDRYRIEVIYYAPTLKEGEIIKEKLIKYKEIDEIILFQDI